MATLQTIKHQIQELIDLSNTTTGNSDTDLTTAVTALTGGYGSGDLSDVVSLIGDGDVIEGSGSGSVSPAGYSFNIAYGDIEPSDTSMLWCKCSEPSSVLARARVDGVENINTSTATLPTALTSMGVGVVGTKTYIFGGYTSAGYTNTIQVFDTETETITTLSTTLPTALSSMGVGVMGTKIYIFGGYTGGGYTNTIQVFDTETETITTLSTTLPTGICSMGIGVVGTKMYILGGRYKSNNTGYYVNTISVFDTETETITTLSTTLPNKLYGMGVEVVNTNIYVLGGNGSQTVNTISVFDTETGTITTLSTTLPNKLYDLQVGAVGTKIYIFGGCYSGTGTYYSDIYMFDTETTRLALLSTTLPTKLGTMGIGIVGTKMYIFGGYTGSSSLSTIKVFSIASPLDENTLQLQTTPVNNIFEIIDGIEVGVKNVYIGNSEGYAEKVDAYLYKDGSWTLI